MSPFLLFRLNKKIKLSKLKLRIKKKMINKLKATLNQSIEREVNLKKQLTNSYGVEELFLEENADLMAKIEKIKEENQRLIDNQISFDFEILRYKSILDQMEKSLGCKN